MEVTCLHTVLGVEKEVWELLMQNGDGMLSFAAGTVSGALNHLSILLSYKRLSKLWLRAFLPEVEGK